MRLSVPCQLIPLFLVSFSSTSVAQDAVVQRKTNLRKDPSADRAPIGILVPDENVRVLDTSSSARYIKVRTEDKRVGWVLKTTVQVFGLTSGEETPNRIGATTSASKKTPPPSVPALISSTWPKQTPVTVAYAGVEGNCPAGGKGGDTATNLLKNRSDDLPEVHDVPWSAIANLPYPAAPASRAHWTKQQLAQIRRFEGVAIRTAGYLAHESKVEDAGTGETTNCKFLEPDDVDWHIYLAESPSDTGLEKAVIVETTPRIRQKRHWDFNVLERYVGKGPVRISGFLMLDPEHRSQVGTARATVWEIHPVTKIEVCDDSSCVEGQWKDLDGLK